MFKNKKEPKKEETVDETFSLTALNIPVIKESVPENVEASTIETQPLEEHIESKIEKVTRKGPNVLWAKVLVAIIIGFVLILGLYKFVDYLNGPKVLFEKTIESMGRDIISVLKGVSEDELYKALSMDKYEMGIDTKVDASNLGAEEAHLENVINNLKYVSDVAIDRNAGSINAIVKASKDNVEKFTFSYVETDRKKYVSIPLIYGKYIELENNLDLIKFNPELCRRVLELLHKQFLGSMSERKFDSKNESIGLNGKTVDCLKTIYQFTSSEMNVFIDKLYEEIKKDNVSYVFMAYLLGLDTNGLDKRFEELKKYMGLSFDGVYELSSFVNRDNNEGVKLELKFIDRSNGQSIDKSFSLVRESGFIGFEKRAGDVISSISIRGNVSNTFTIQKTDAESVYNFTLRNKDGKREGALSIVGKSTNETKLEATFSYKIDKTTNTSYTMESSLELKNYETNGGAVYIIDSSIIINGKNEVEASRKIEDSITLDAYEKEANVVFSEKFKSMMRSISIADIAPPQVFTPEMSGNVPSQ